MMVPAPQWGGTFWREQIVSRLLAYGTLAGSTVTSSRSIPFAQDMTPAINVATPLESKSLLSEAGSTPEFMASLTVHLQAYVEGPTDAAAEALLDMLVAQIHDCLLSDASFVAIVEKIRSVDVKTEFPANSDRHLGIADVVFTLEYRDLYNPRTPNTLRLVSGQVTLDPAAAAVPTEAPVTAQFSLPTA